LKLHAFLLGQDASGQADPAQVYRDLIGDAQFAEEIGYAGVWVSEHHFSNYSLIPSPASMLTMLACETEKIRIGAAVIVLPLHNPVRAVEDMNMVDQISGGRLDIAFGRGYQPYEFQGLGVDFNDSSDIMREGMEVATHLWTRPDEAFTSKRFSIPPLTVLPSPRQLPHPPLWMGVGPGSMGVALDMKFKIIANVGKNGPELAERLREKLLHECAIRAIDPGQQTFALQTHAYLVENEQDREFALSSARFLDRVQSHLKDERPRVRRGIHDAYDPVPGESTYEGFSGASLVGSHDHMVRQIQRFAKLGVTDLFITAGYGEFTPEHTRRTLRDVADAVAAASLATSSVTL
jgi:alkanesulfonate monooxygenase SsuD/methylene tetrahydromethanopterin reductase-like flavin-dependent oxidoreductase (luciferase family)